MTEPQDGLVAVLQEASHAHTSCLCKSCLDYRETEATKKGEENGEAKGSANGFADGKAEAES